MVVSTKPEPLTKVWSWNATAKKWTFVRECLRCNAAALVQTLSTANPGTVYASGRMPKEAPVAMP